MRRPEQEAPKGDWFVWLILAGRGWGKTRTGAEYVIDALQSNPGWRAALVAPSFDDGRDTMCEGESGIVTLLQTHAVPHTWNRSLGQLLLRNGSRADIYSSERPKQLRGPQHHVAWGDEPAVWNDAHLGDREDTTFSNLKLGLRLGEDPRMVLTTTPRRVRLLHGSEGAPGLIDLPNVAVTRGTTYDNLLNLAPAFRRNVVEPYEGTRLGRQELYAEDIGDTEGALWTRDLIEYREAPVYFVDGKMVPAMQRMVVGVDPSTTGKRTSDEAGIVVAGFGFDGNGYVFDDRSLRGSPNAWGSAAAQAYHDYRADRIIVEDNQGGEMTEDTIRAVDPNLPVTRIHAMQSKQARAEPVSALYERHKVFHVRSLPLLEDEQCNWQPSSGASPNRLDALVHALTELMLQSSWSGSYGSGIA